MNWYVLYALTYKVDQLIKNLNKNRDIEAFTPKYEYYRRKEKDYAIKPLFNGYIFVKTKFDQIKFNAFMNTLKEEKEGLIYQLVKEGTTALRLEEIEMFETLLDCTHTIRMSNAYLKDGKAVVEDGPLQVYEDKIIRVDRHNQIAYLDLSFMGRQIKGGLKIITSKK